ncbi:MAG: serine/threonine protein kinase, partial [Holophagales bacterium]|nr:serine/threonine protein kinase [Holophagales bacterium]
MDLEQQQRLLKLSEEGLGEPPENRARYLERACGADLELRREAEAALAAEEGLLGGPAFDIHTDDQRVGRLLGPYRVERLIETGGMGAVYEAVREDLGTRVAVKVMRQGLDLDSSLLRRFHAERRILARLEHPHIARLLDAGTTDDGLPYFAMEYVDGEPIDAYCNRLELNLEARIRLFRKVCSAVQLAHRNLVVHRDLKPGNILVGTDGEPKLLDFGIAKVLNPSLARAQVVTGPAIRLMTPEYA